MPIAAVTLYSNEVSDPFNQFVNVFGYDSPTGAVTQSVFDGFVSAWRSAVLDKLIPLVPSNIQYTKLAIRDMSGGGYEFENIFSPIVTGSSGAEMLPKFVAYGFQYNRATVGQRSGAKRFVGVNEAGQSNGVPTGVTVGLLATLATALGSTIVAPSGDWVPKILHKTGVGTADGHDISGVVFKRITTQNSRKR